MKTRKFSLFAEMETTEHSRLGGELPLFTDRLGERRTFAPSWLAFSHGRAALAWLIERRKPKSALICAYTCPTVPAFLRRRDVPPSLFDAEHMSDAPVAAPAAAAAQGSVEASAPFDFERETAAPRAA